MPYWIRVCLDKTDDEEILLISTGLFGYQHHIIHLKENVLKRINHFKANWVQLKLMGYKCNIFHAII